MDVKPSLQAMYHSQRYQLELKFETDPKNSRYSTNLVNLMRIEEKLVQKGGGSHSGCSLESITEKVNDMLRQETRAFFADNSRRNMDGWKALGEDIKVDKGKNRANKGANKALDALEAEEYRLDMDYNRNWTVYEKFHLTEAFKSQQARIEMDMRNQTKLLHDEFNEERAKYTPSIKTGSVDIGGGGGYIGGGGGGGGGVESPSRWHHEEKQKQLFNTVPVLLPSPTNRGKSALGVARGSQQSNRELDRIDKEETDALIRLSLQKGNATRWLLRQRIRLEGQMDEVVRERNFIASDVIKHIED